MFLTELLTKGSKLRTAKNLTTKARKQKESTAAEQLFASAYHAYAEVVQGYPQLVEALYQWGIALYHHAQKCQGARAEALYREAATKFEFCTLVHPTHLGAAIDWGATLMAWARERHAAPHDELYNQARQQFERANAIQKASASYNLACLHALRNEFDACQAMLEQARDHGSLPDVNIILEDGDLAAIQQHAWFKVFLQSVMPSSPNIPPQLVSDNTASSVNQTIISSTDNTAITFVSSNNNPTLSNCSSTDETTITPAEHHSSDVKKPPIDHNPLITSNGVDDKPT